MPKKSLLIILGIAALSLGVFVGIRFSPGAVSLSSSVVATNTFSTMTEAQLRAFIAQEKVILAQAIASVAQSQNTIALAQAALDALLATPNKCANGMTNYPACNNGICQDGYRLQWGVCVSDCRVVYAVTPSQSGSTQINSDMNFVFTNPTLEQQYKALASKVSFVYDRASAELKWQFDMAGRTYICAPFTMSKNDDTLVGKGCDLETEELVTCTDPNNQYSITATCTDALYTYTLNKCSSVSPLTLTWSVSAPTTGIGRAVIFSVVPTGWNGTYTYSWTGTDSLTGNTASVTKSYTTPGTKTATVSVTSGDQTKTLVLSSTVAASPLVVNIVSTATTSVPKTNQDIVYTANVSGWTPPYTYNWSGSDSLTGSTSRITKKYLTAGTKTVTLTVRSSNGLTQTKTITINVTSPPLPPRVTPITASCYATWSRTVWKVITWTVTASGGTGSYTYAWAGWRTTKTIQKTYTTSGTKTETVRVYSGADSKMTQCSVVIQKSTPVFSPI